MKTYGVALVIFFVVDMIWLGLVAKNFYRKELGFFLRDQPNWLAAITFYLLFIVGLVYFVIGPALKEGDMSRALIGGLLFGLITYSTYDLTNLATLKAWPLKITLIDMVWGTSLGGIVSTLTYIIIKKLS